MAIVGQNYLTITDLVKRGQAANENWATEAAMVELLRETNELLMDANFVECNDGSSHKSSVRTGLPSATWRMLYGGVQPSKSETAQVSDTTGMLEAYSEVDTALVRLARNEGQFRLEEASAFLEAINIELQDCVFYGNKESNAAKFDGLAVRYGAKSADPKKIGYNIVDGGGTGSDNTSIWFITFGNAHTSLIYPRGSKAGLERKDLGEVTKELSGGSMFQVMREHFKWDVGLTVRDWRSTCRIANLDVSDMLAGSVAVENFMIDAFYKIRKYSKTGKPIIYANSETLAALHKRAKDKSNVNLSLNEYEGREVVTFLGKIPIRECDQILSTEARVV